MGELLSALKSTAVEIADSKKAIASITTILGASLVAIAGRFKLEWLDPETAKLIAGLIVFKGSVYVLGQAHVDGKKEQAAVPTTLASPPNVIVTTGTSTASSG